ncbi:MAG: hypothetical protein JWL95_1392 [Gemmatimonadetes bacterium]|nr:hypothetical protein [Gemmatimonadota bacterium]
MTEHLTFDQLCDVADAPFGATELSVAREHVGACSVCAEQLAAISALSVETARLPRAVAPPPELWTAIRSELGALRYTSTPWWKRSTTRLVAAGVLIGMSSSALTILALRTRHQSGTVPAVSAATRATPATRALPAHLASAELGYARSVAELRRTLDERRGSLAMSTVATVEQSLRVADSAIAEARDALQRDPANGVLAKLFASNYERKIDLLRRATELAPRT